MRFDVMTLFPDLVRNIVGTSITGRALAGGLFELYCHDIRDFTHDNYRRVDDYPYGGGSGMVMQAPPIRECFDHICGEIGQRPHVLYMSPQGRVFDQQYAKELLQRPNITILCGHYEGVDQRILDAIVDEEVSIGDFVLTGGEVPAAVVIDAVARMIPGVLKQENGFVDESHYHHLLEYPQYTRPPVFEGREVPEVLLSGHHANIQKWRRQRQLEKTWRVRPDLLDKAELSRDDRRFLLQLREQEKE
ncbi:MAG: tRNA (guanosine(37)-N1)-methyltransferase TrmD [Eubacteriales bacterium]|jgi:tRNA (guanine37-N1)-methyltransferase